MLTIDFISTNLKKKKKKLQSFFLVNLMNSLLKLTKKYFYCLKNTNKNV